MYVGFIDGKEKAMKNKTMSWLPTKCSNKPSKIICFLTTRACRMKLIQHQREETVFTNLTSLQGTYLNHMQISLMDYTMGML